MTLIELMIAVVVLTILTAVAWPNFQEAIRKSRRADGMGALTTLVQAQERFRSNNAAYESDLSKVPGAPTGSPDGHYTLAVNGTSASGYTATATATSSAQTADSACRVLRVTVNGGSITYGSSNAGGTVNTTDPCWVK